MIVYRNLGVIGRLGNQLFQVASTLGIANRHKYEVAFPLWRNVDHKDRFGSIEDIEVHEHLVNPLPTAQDLERFPELWVHWGYQPGPFPDNVSLNGHMQSERYFSHCMNVVRHYLTFKGEPEQNDLVAIHYRAGDYIEDDNAYHPRCSKEYYTKAFSQFPKDTKYLLFSDDQERAQELIEPLANGPLHVYKGENYLADFKTMKKCKSFITANSTYSLFAAIIADHPEKKIVCPRNWFGPTVGLDTKDIYPEKAIVL